MSIPRHTASAPPRCGRVTVAELLAAHPTVRTVPALRVLDDEARRLAWRPRSIDMSVQRIDDVLAGAR